MTRSDQLALPGDRNDGWLQWDLGPASWPAWLVAVGFAGLLGLAVLRSAAGRPDWLLAWRVGTAFLLFSGVLMVGRHLATTGLAFGDGTRATWGLFAARMVLLSVLVVVVVQSRSPSVGLGVHRIAETVAILGALVGLCALADDPRRYTAAQWVVLTCFATVAGIYFYHSLFVAETSLASRHPLWASVVMGVCLFVLPQYLPSELFLWALCRVAGLAVALGLPVYVVGEYALWGLQFRYHHSYVVPLVGLEVTAIRSLFVNQNALAMVALAGLLAAVTEYHRADRRDGSVPSLVVPILLVIVTATGLVASIGRALWVIGLATIGIYGAYVAFGREAIPAAVLAGTAYLLGGLLAVYLAVRTGVLASDPSDRFHLWGASVDAIVHGPRFLGEGTASPAGVILEYRDSETPVSPHNSYLTIWIRTGLVGGLAYIGSVVTTLIDGTRRYRTVDVALLALAFAFATHQLFEAYTMLWWTTGSAYASLAIGFLLFDDARTPS